MTYSQPFKIITKRTGQVEKYLPPHPLHVDIELSEACNLICKMCEHGVGIAGKGGLMDKELAFRVIDECCETFEKLDNFWLALIWSLI